MVVAARLRPAESHPWPQPLPGSWIGSFDRSQPVAYTPVEPEIVAEIEVDPAVERGRWRHSVRFVALRADLSPLDVPLHSTVDG